MGRTMGENADLDMDFAHHVKAILVSSRVKVPAPILKVTGPFGR